MAWSISPSTASIDNNGNAWFPESGQKYQLFTVTYTDSNGCSSHVYYTVPGCSPSPSTDTISFRAHNCTSDDGTIELVSITLSDGSTVSCDLSEFVNRDGGEESLGSVDVTGKVGMRITGGTVKFNGSITSDYSGLSGPIRDGAEFTVTIGNCGGEPTKNISTSVNKGSATPSGTIAEDITFTAGGSNYTITDALLNFDTSAEAIPYPVAMFGKTITAVSVKTEVGETFSATVNPTTINNSTNQVTVTLQGGTSSCSVNFNVYNRSTTTIGLVDAVEIFYTDMSNSFHFQIGSIAPGSSQTVNVQLHGGDAGACGKKIVGAYLQGPSQGSGILELTGGDVMNDGATINLQFNG